MRTLRPLSIILARALALTLALTLAFALALAFVPVFTQSAFAAGSEGSGTVLINSAPVNSDQAIIVKVTGDSHGGYTATKDGDPYTFGTVFSLNGENGTITLSADKAQVSYAGVDIASPVALDPLGSVDLVFPLNKGVEQGISAVSVEIKPEGNVFLLNANLFVNTNTGTALWVNEGYLAAWSIFGVRINATASLNESVWKNTGTLILTAGESIVASAKGLQGATWTNTGSIAMTALDLAVYAGTNSGESATWDNAGRLELDTTTVALLGSNTNSTAGVPSAHNEGLIHVQNNTCLAMFDRAACLRNTGAVYFDKDARFGYDIPFKEYPLNQDYYQSILNARCLTPDSYCINSLLPGLSDAWSIRAVYELQNEGITQWLTFDFGKVYKEKPAPFTKPALSTGDNSPIIFQGKHYWEVEAGDVTSGDPAQSKQELAETSAPDTAIYVPAGSTGLYLPDFGLLESSLYTLRGHANNTEGSVPPVDQSIVLTKEGAGTLTLTGDHSWYNGVFNVGHSEKDNSGNRVIIIDTAALFGGDVTVYSGAALEWRGGAKDAFDMPIITLLGGTLDMNLATAGPPVNRFSFYGSLAAEEHSSINLSAGQLCLGGVIEVASGGQLSLFAGATTVETLATGVLALQDGSTLALDVAGLTN
ncbi:MAG: hypothetical protein LBP91_04150, partial [Coriobacteriales bacterium]|nr:hypothetical protein [Coriobacteriales bacterium]